MTDEERKARRRESRRKWAEKNPDYQRQYRERHKAALLAQKREYREPRRAELAAASRAYYHANKERIAERDRAYREANRELISERDRRWREANYERKAETDRRWRRSNPTTPAQNSAKNASRKARIAGNGGGFTPEEFIALGDVCVYCGAKGKMTPDHIIPLARGGTNDISNITPACLSCNCSKADLTAEEYQSSDRYKRRIRRLATYA